jgi:hypothetical protein
MWFEDHLRSLKEPQPNQKIWAQNPKKLTILFIESDRPEMSKYNLWNIAHVYGGTDVGLHIICSPRNLEAMREHTRDWTNVVITWDTLNSREDFSRFVTSIDFYHRFVSSHILVTSWDAYIFRKIDEKYFEYDYVGAPFLGSLMDPTSIVQTSDLTKGPRIGNGGFSLRKIKPCYEYSLQNQYKPRHPDDVFLAFANLKVPSVRDAYDFSVECKLYDETPPILPVGMHKIWDRRISTEIPETDFFGEEDFKRWCNIKT